MRAVSDGDLPALKKLLESGADVNSANQSGQTALMLAAVMGYADIVACLMEAGANPQMRDRLGLTAMEWSTRRGFSEITQLLTKLPALRPTPSVTTAAKEKIPVVPPAVARESEPAEVLTSFEKPIEPPALANDSAASSTVSSATGSQSQGLTDSPAQQPAPSREPRPQVGNPIESAAAVAHSQTVESESTSETLHQSPAEEVLRDEGDDTPTQPRIPKPAPDITPLRTTPTPASPVSKTASSASVQKPLTNERTPAFAASPLGLSTTPASDHSADVSNFKRCPKCNAVYQNTFQLYCTHDRSALVGTHDLQPVAAATNSSTPIAVWLLIALVLGISAFGAYRLTAYLFRTEEASVPVAAKPTQPPVEAKKPSFSVGGALAGMEMNIPEPEYPAELQSAGVSGPITVRIRVNKNGRVISAAASSGDRQLRAAAVKAARQATFAADKLAEVSPRSNVVSGTITYEFALPPPRAEASPTASQADTGASTTNPQPSNADPNVPVVSEELVSAAIEVPAAEYPSRARRAGIEGTITVTVRVNHAGKVISWRSSTGDSQLRAAAIRAARKATFSSEKLPGSGDVLGTITYNFKP
jgi:TonB family protein